MEQLPELRIDLIFTIRGRLQLHRTLLAVRQVPPELGGVLPDRCAALQEAPTDIVHEVLGWLLVHHKRVDLVQHQDMVVVHALAKLASSCLLRVKGSDVPSLAVDDPGFVRDAFDHVVRAIGLPLAADDGEALRRDRRVHLRGEGAEERAKVLEVPQDEALVAADDMHSLARGATDEDRQHSDQDGFALAGAHLGDECANALLGVFQESLEHEEGEDLGMMRHSENLEIALP
mmetsp:Transcript_5840/g.16480  ORF Transcript_5840/g.16480 Transcript_5840/m.16480 type:complete len:232 (-) Transcript_5840:995-1690(-)